MIKSDNRDNVKLASQILTEYSDFISTVILARVQNKEQADDIYQNFFLSLISKPVPANVNNIKSYLYKAVNNDIADATRRVQRYRTHIKKYSETANSSINNTNPADALIKEEQKNKMFELIMKELPISSSRAITYRYGNDQSVQEVAKTMRVKSTSVSRYISTGLERIRQILS